MTDIKATSAPIARTTATVTVFSLPIESDIEAQICPPMEDIPNRAKTEVAKILL